MFYSAQVLSKKGPLGSVWIASWSQRSLKRQEVFSCSLPAAVDSIINPEAPLALRLSGQLLLGLVRLYLRKLQFLEEDAGLTLRGLVRNAAAGQGGPSLDLPDGGVAPEVAITLQDGGYDPMAAFVGGELFPSFDSSLYGEGPGAEGASLTVAADISELFGSRWTGEEERAERRFSTELERLRSQGVEAPRDRADMFFGGGDELFSPAVPMEDELMAVPPEELLAAAPGTAPRPSPASAAHAPLPGLSDMRITPHSLPSAGGGAGLLPEVGMSPGTAGGAGFFDDGGTLARVPAEEEDGALPAGAATAGRQPARRARPAQRRRRAVVDVSADGRPATTLPSDQIRALLADRKPLMTRRGLRARRQRPTLPPGRYDVVAQSDAARDSQLFSPACFSSLAPQLVQLFARAQKLPGAAAAEATPVRQRRRSSRGAAAEGAGLATGQAGASPAPSAGPSGCAPASMFSGGVDAFDLPSAGGFEDAIEPADSQQQQQQQQGVELFPMGQEEDGGGGAAGERLGRLPLQPVLGSSEELGHGAGSGSSSLAARSGGSSGSAPQSSFTRNTALVLEHLRAQLAPAPGSKRRHPSHGDLAAGVAHLSLDDLLQSGGAGGGQRGRLDAARWFYESLVLRNAGFVTLSQEQPYGDILILPTPHLTNPDS